MDIKKNVPLAAHTTLHIGGAAEHFVAVHSEEELTEALSWAREKSLPTTILGGGSNVLIADEGVKGLVIKNEIGVPVRPPARAGGITYSDRDDIIEVVAGAGIVWDDLVAETVARGLWGLENLSGIPGTVGGAIVQNINAYGVTIEEFIETVEVVHVGTDTKRVFTRDECEFAYRDSLFKHTGPGKEYIVTGARMRLSHTPKIRSTYKSASQSIRSYFEDRAITKPTPSDVRAAVLEVRGRIGMLERMYQSAGSFFTNVMVSAEEFERVHAVVEQKYPDRSAQFSPWHWPLPDGKVKVSAAFLMECTPYNKTNFAGKAFNGTVGISPVHTLSLINLEGATASDVRAFADKIKTTVQKEFGVILESELSFL